MKKRLLLLPVVVGLCLAFAACNSWERQTYQALSASKAAIDQAVSDYNAGLIPQTQATAALLTKARAAQTAAVEAFEEYAVIKVAKQTTNLASAQQLVEQAMAQIPPLLAAIHALYAGGTNAG